MSIWHTAELLKRSCWNTEASFLCVITGGLYDEMQSVCAQLAEWPGKFTIINPSRKHLQRRDG